MNSVALTILICTTIPYSEVKQERCSHIENNVVYNQDGTVNLDQLIFSDRDPWAGDVVRDWRLTRKTGLPQYDWQRKLWVVRWFEGDVMREVRAETFDTVFSFEDREIADRLIFPDTHRRKLLK